MLEGERVGRGGALCGTDGARHHCRVP
jgi:hypothetical protein